MITSNLNGNEEVSLFIGLCGGFDAAGTSAKTDSEAKGNRSHGQSANRQGRKTLCQG
uniref:hypothetical protein n=1 Tax=Prevotella amnii TaxID=419005 RepID=UPI001E4C3205|nr:hypothetical protein [Prevotella amnii]